MKKICLSVLILSLLFIAACTKDSCENPKKSNESSPSPKITLSAQEFMSIAYDDPKEISEEEIRTIIENFVSQEYVALNNQTRASNEVVSFKKAHDIDWLRKCPQPRQGAVRLLRMISIALSLNMIMN